jgi:hypothetical protein
VTFMNGLYEYCSIVTKKSLCFLCVVLFVCLSGLHLIWVHFLLEEPLGLASLSQDLVFSATISFSSSPDLKLFPGAAWFSHGL